MERRKLSWYRSAVKQETSRYKKNFKKYVLDEKNDRVGSVEEQDENQLRNILCKDTCTCLSKAKMRHLPYYDKFPLVYVQVQQK